MIDAVEKHIVVVGLGNPGQAYEMTRHNMGYLVVQALIHAENQTFKEVKAFQALVAKCKCDDITVHYLLPLTYMNMSGLAVSRCLSFYKLRPTQLVVVTDDIALPFGVMRVRDYGSAGGHNGLKSIQEHIGTQHYVRLRMGIGAPEGRNLAEYVLDAFSKEERAELPKFIQEGVIVLKRLLLEPASSVMNSVNVQKQK